MTEPSHPFPEGFPYLPTMKVALVFLLTYSIMAATTNTSTNRTPPIPALTETTEVSSVLLCAAATGGMGEGVACGVAVVGMATVQFGLCSCVR